MAPGYVAQPPSAVRDGREAPMRHTAPWQSRGLHYQWALSM
jgi:hypothetical protein